MTELAHIYTKKRKDFGKHCKFTAVPAFSLLDIPTVDTQRNLYVMKNPNVSCFDTAPQMSEHEVNTERLVSKNSSMRHVEGGWAKEIDYTEQSDTNRFRKKAEKDEDYKIAVKVMAPLITRCMKQNNTVDIYEEYFEGDTRDHSSEPPSAKGIAVFKDPLATMEIKRTVSSINWHPELNKIAVTYSILNFQDHRLMNTKLSPQSYIWDLTNPNTPEYEIIPPSPLCCLKFNPKYPDTLIGGSYNGMISFYDLRKTSTSNTKEILPNATSLIENSHHDPVYDIFWINSKTGNQAVSVSTDGRILWWDTRKLNEPTDIIDLSTDIKNNGQILGGCSLEYNSEAGASKYLVGTEQGVVLLINLKNRKQNNGVQVFDQNNGKHHGPITSIHRNPTNTKCFLTVGDWTTKIWMEDIKTPIMSTKYHSAYITSGCWSPTRPGVFFVTRMDGVVDVWDYHYRQNEVTYSHKVGDTTLSTISVQQSSQTTQTQGGKLVAIGDINGTVTLLELCDSLAVPQANERKAMDAMFDREIKQEKNLEARERDIRRQKTLLEQQQQQQQSNTNTSKGVNVDASASTANLIDLKDDKMESLLRKVDADFLAMIKEAEDDESKAAEISNKNSTFNADMEMNSANPSTLTE